MLYNTRSFCYRSCNPTTCLDDMIHCPVSTNHTKVITSRRWTGGSRISIVVTAHACGIRGVQEMYDVGADSGTGTRNNDTCLCCCSSNAQYTCNNLTDSILFLTTESTLSRSSS
jgi:hypothetical protein